jgi:hypothetical protein
MFSPDPDFFPSRANNNKKEARGKQFFVLSFFVAINFTKFVKYFKLEIFFKTLSQPTKNLGTYSLPKNFLLCSQKYGWESRMRKKLLPDPDTGVKKNHQIQDPNPQYWF